MPKICSTELNGTNVTGDCLRYHTERTFRVQSVDMDFDVCAECVKSYEQSRHWRITESGTPWRGLDASQQDDGAIHLYDGNAELFCIVPAGDRAEQIAARIIAALTPKETSDA